MHTFRDKEIYRPQQMYDIGNGDMSYCCFDFSSIPSSNYHGFFNGLPQLLYKKVKSVRFCTDNYLKIENESDRTDAQSIELDRSIFKSNSNYSHYLAKVIWRVLPRAKILISLVVDSIPLRNDEFQQIVDAIRKNKSLRSVTFRNTLIRDDDFIYFLGKVSPYRFETIEFSNCQLTSNVYNKVCEFLNSQPPPAGSNGNMANSEWRLRVFNLDENDISSENIDIIDAMMQKKLHGNETDDQPTITTEEGNQFERNPFGKRGINNPSYQSRGNDGPKDDEYEEDGYEEEEDENDGKHGRRRGKHTDINIKVHHLKDQEIQLTSDHVNMKSIDAIEEIKRRAAEVKKTSPHKKGADLRIENEKLRKELNELIKKVHAIKYSDDVFLIGVDAEKNLEDIRIAEQHIQEYEKVHGPIKITK